MFRVNPTRTTLVIVTLSALAFAPSCSNDVSGPMNPGLAGADGASGVGPVDSFDDPAKPRVLTQIRLSILAGHATPAPPVGPALGQHGVNIMAFCTAFNAATRGQVGMLPVVITVYQDRSFTFITRTPPPSP